MHEIDEKSPLADYDAERFKECDAHQDRPKVVNHGRYVAFQMAEVAIPSVRRHSAAHRGTSTAASHINRVKRSFVTRLSQTHGRGASR
jgi:hypothetical protein